MSHLLLNVLKVKWSLFVLFALISLTGFGQKPIFTDEVNLQYSNGISSEFIRRSSGFQAQAREIFHGRDRGWNASLNFDYIRFPEQIAEYSVSILPGYRFFLLEKLALDVNLGWGLCYVSYQVDSPGKVMDNYEIFGQLYDDITLRYFITKEINVSSSIRGSFSLRHLRHVENIDAESFSIFVGLGVGWTFSE